MAAKHEKSQHPNKRPLSQTRRQALKKMLIGTGVAAGAAVFPEKWAKPVVDRVLVPAHAQTSETIEKYLYDVDEKMNILNGNEDPMIGAWVAITIIGAKAEIDRINERRTALWKGTIDQVPGKGKIYFDDGCLNKQKNNKVDYIEVEISKVMATKLTMKMTTPRGAVGNDTEVPWVPDFPTPPAYGCPSKV